MEAKLTITYGGQQGELPDFINADASDAEIRAWAAEAVAQGSIPGLPAQVADFTDHVIDRFPPNDVRPNSVVVLRAKTPFGVTI